MTKPASGDYAPFYANYIAMVDTADIVDYLNSQKDQALAFFKAIVWEKWDQAYAPQKWTFAEVVLHMIDAERIFAYRALRIARGDKTPMPGFEHDDYVPLSEASSRTPASLVDEFIAVREANIQLFKNFTDAMWVRRGTASNAEVTTLALAYIVAGHTAHHLKILEERYV